MGLRKIYITSFFYTLSLSIYGQQEIRLVNKSQCDSLYESCHFINIQNGPIKCSLYPNENQILYFTKEAEFQEYSKKKHSPEHRYCPDTLGVNFDFKKYDVVLYYIHTGSQDSSEGNLKIRKCDTNYVISLNFFDPPLYQILCKAAGYILLPKGGKDIPMFYIYETQQKCY